MVNDQLSPDAADGRMPRDRPAGSGSRVRRLFWGRWRRSVLGAAVACVTVLGLVIAASGVIVPAASASGPPGDSAAYSRASTASEDHSDWLASVNGSTPIWQLSIPGTHDSYTAKLSGAGPSFQTQTMSVPEQLKMGIRAIDLRLDACENYAPVVCPDNRKDFTVEHGGYSTFVTLSGVLDQLKTFLSAHPTEFVIVRAKVDDEGTDFTTNMNAILDKYSDILWRGNASAAFEDPTLNQVRGKVVLLKEFPKTSPTINSYGMKYNATGFVIQDDWYLVTNWSLYSKWDQVVDNWTNSVAYAKTGGTSKGYINYLSGNGGSFPYFVASGYSSESGPPLSTGMTSTAGGASKYPDFHWVACFLGTCTVAFTGTNILTYDVLSGQNRAGSRHDGLPGQQGMGLIYIDFPGQPLVNSIIANNPGAGPTGPIVAGVDSKKCVDLNDGLGFNGNKVQMWDCGGYRPAQTWTVNANGTITAGGGCLDINGGASKDGTLIMWYTCHGSTNQQWRAQDGQLVNPASGKCLDDPGGNTANGTQLILWVCTGGSNQKWNLPRAPLPSMSLSASETQVTEGQSPVFTVRMPADATGQVGFYNLSLTGSDKGIGVAPIVGGVAVLRTPTRALPLGRNVIEASYGGSPIYAPNDSNTVTVTVTAP
jgi:1-phosphatidylinositol phosphodiesterase